MTILRPFRRDLPRTVSTPRILPRAERRFGEREGVLLAELIALLFGRELMLAFTDWAGPRTGSVGEAQMLEILGTAEVMLLIVFVPLVILRLGLPHLASRSRPIAGFACALHLEETEASSSWRGMARRLLHTAGMTLFASAAAVTVMQAFEVTGAGSRTTILMSVALLAGIVHAAWQRDVEESISAVQAAEAQAREEREREEENQMNEPGEETMEKGTAARSTNPIEGLPPGVFARGRFFVEMERGLRDMESESRPFTLLIVGAYLPAAGTLPPNELRAWLGNAIVANFGEEVPVGYLGNDLFAVGLAGLAADDARPPAEQLHFAIMREASEHGCPSVDPRIGLSTSWDEQTARTLYARALESFQLTREFAI